MFSNKAMLSSILTAFFLIRQRNDIGVSYDSPDPYPDIGRLRLHRPWSLRARLFAGPLSEDRLNGKAARPRRL